MMQWQNLRFDQLKAEEPAEQTRLFERKGFVETPLYQRLEQSEASIILGRKGSGKTAHVKALLRHHKDYQRMTDEIVLKDFPPRQFFAIIGEINKILQIEDYQLARNLWVVCLAMRVMDQIRSNSQRVARLDNEGKKAVEHIAE